MMRKGAKRGPGRPRVPADQRRVMVSYKLPRTTVDWLRNQSEPATRLVEDALERCYKISAAHRKGGR